MEKKILRILLKHYTKISYKGGIAKVIFDDEFENIAEEIAKYFKKIKQKIMKCKEEKKANK